MDCDGSCLLQQKKSEGSKFEDGTSFWIYAVTNIVSYLQIVRNPNGFLSARTYREP
jgi:hypothetical protein